MNKYSGEVAGSRMWMFNLGVAVSQADSKSGEEVRKLMNREDASRFPSDWDPSKAEQVDQAIYQNYKSELYG
eukprot:8753082-Karenia_brevis.AAC.1